MVGGIAPGQATGGARIQVATGQVPTPRLIPNRGEPAEPAPQVVREGGPRRPPPGQAIQIGRFVVDPRYYTPPAGGGDRALGLRVRRKSPLRSCFKQRTRLLRDDIFPTGRVGLNSPRPDQEGTCRVLVVFVGATWLSSEPWRARVGSLALIGGLMAGVEAAASSAQATSSCTGTLTVTCTYSGAADNATVPPNRGRSDIEPPAPRAVGPPPPRVLGVATVPT